MQLEEMRQLWQQLDQKLNRSLALETELARQAMLRPARRRVRWLSFWPGLDAAFGAATIALCALFLVGHGQDWRLAASAVAVLLGGILLLASSILQFHVMARLDWSGPVASIQSTLVSLRMLRIRQFKWTILLAPLLGFAAFLMGTHWVLEIVSGGQANFLDRLMQISPAWVVANLVFGLLFIPAGFYLARWLARFRHRPWWQAFLDDLGGNSLKSAARDVERWASLTAEPATRNS